MFILIYQCQTHFHVLKENISLTQNRKHRNNEELIVTNHYINRVRINIFQFLKEALIPLTPANRGWCTASCVIIIKYNVSILGKMQNWTDPKISCMAQTMTPRQTKASLISLSSLQ